MQAYERLIRYAEFDTHSDGSNEQCPSTELQRDFARFLAEEMRQIGISDVILDENCYLFGTIPANSNEEKHVYGFIAHMDVVNDVPSSNIKARVIENYDGANIVLNAEKGIVMSPDEFSTLKDYVGHRLVVTDGTTLLGADNKAGIAEILTMAERIIADPSIKHGVIKIGFTPDEEIGRGADLFDVARFGADFAYTVDGGAFGGIEYENFNAASAKVYITGKNIHPGTSKNKMKNACNIAFELAALIPSAERPEHTEMYEGFYHLGHMRGDVEQAELAYILRDHDSDKLEQKKRMMQSAAAFINAKYGDGTVRVEIKDSYRNMAEPVLKYPHLIERARRAIEKAGGVAESTPIRGGSDGSRLSFMGLPCPNLGTGSHNHHGKMEYASADEMEKCVCALINIAKIQ